MDSNIVSAGSGILTVSQVSKSPEVSRPHALLLKNFGEKAAVMEEIFSRNDLICTYKNNKTNTIEVEPTKLTRIFSGANVGFFMVNALIIATGIANPITYMALAVSTALSTASVVQGRRETASWKKCVEEEVQSAIQTYVEPLRNLLECGNYTDGSLTIVERMHHHLTAGRYIHSRMLKEVNDLRQEYSPLKILEKIFPDLGRNQKPVNSDLMEVIQDWKPSNAFDPIYGMLSDEVLWTGFLPIIMKSVEGEVQDLGKCFHKGSAIKSTIVEKLCDILKYGLENEIINADFLPFESFSELVGLSEIQSEFDKLQLQEAVLFQPYVDSIAQSVRDIKATLPEHMRETLYEIEGWYHPPSVGPV